MDASAVLWLSGSEKFGTPVRNAAQLANASSGPTGLSHVSICCMDADDRRLRAARLAAQRLTPATLCARPEDAALAVIGVQAQDLRAAGLALRSRVPGLTRAAVRAAPLLRTWTARGTVHLIAASDRPWLHALFAARNARVFGARFERFGIVEDIRAMCSDVVELCAERPRDRASLLRALLERGHPSLDQGPINTFVPWLSTQGLIVTDTAGILQAADPPPPVDHDEALAILGARYRAGYGPCDATDLAKWSSLPITQARRALEAAGPQDDIDAWPTDEPPPARCLRRSTPSCSGTAPDSRSSPPNTTTTSSRVAACSSPSRSTAV
jgi:hypothetical protein